MKFASIWTLPGYSLSERFIRTRDWAAMAIASKLPIRVRYWVTMQELGHATMDSPNIPATKVEDILPKLRAPKVLR
jgi:hypothetical protein